MKHQFNKNQIKHHWRNVTTFSICLGLLTSVVAGGFGLSWHAQNEPADTTSKPNPGAIKPITSASQDPTATGNPNDKGEDQPAGLPIAPRDIAPVEGSKSLKLTMKDLGDADGYDLNGVRTERRYDFTRPTGWKVLPSSNIQVSFEHSQALLPERSSLNILVNNRILKTVPLTLANVTANTLAIPIPPQILKDRNTVSFQVDQHYTYKCEDPYSSELWTKILDSTNLRIDYTPQPIQPDLARFPFPLYDPLGYGDTEITYIAPAGKLSNESLSALGVTSTKMGQHLSWHPLKTTLADASALQSDKNLIVIGTPSENSAIGQLASSLEVPLQGDKFLDKKTRTPLPDNDGVIQYIPNPAHPSKVILVISGNSPTGVSAAARLLAQNPTNQLLVGRSSIIEEQHVGPLHPYRAWDGFIQTSGTSFADLGLDTLTTRGFSSPPIYYSIKRMPDLYFPGQTKV
ncbi:MAG: cellulose biosynthesis cyclic di-GMP-binding regulatory protein BcsB, partial [Cyanobacteria bacterium]|nr:cellulose biosynthesis cyclic di-GMP-binding regulatory protein BcsB [Cyanobacteriota bacterium]